MGLFGLINYEDYILNAVAKSAYTRNGLIVVLIYIITGFIRFHLSILISVLVVWNNSFDLIFPVIVTVLLSLVSHNIFRYVETHRSWHESIVDYLMIHYSRKNFIRWKRCVLVVLCAYVLAGLCIVTIDNYFILVSTLQTAASFIICDLLENKIPQTWYNYFVKWLGHTQIYSWWTNPRVTKSAQSHIIENYPFKRSQSTPPKQLRRRSLDAIKLQSQTLSRPQESINAPRAAPMQHPRPVTPPPFDKPPTPPIVRHPIQ